MKKEQKIKIRYTPNILIFTVAGIDVNGSSKKFWDIKRDCEDAEIKEIKYSDGIFSCKYKDNCNYKYEKIIDLRNEK